MGGEERDGAQPEGGGGFFPAGPDVGYPILKEGAANILLFTLGGIALAPYRRSSAMLMVWTTAVVAVVIAVLQYVLAVGHFRSIDDVLRAFLGGLLGVSAGLRIQRLVKSTRKAPTNARG